MRLPSFTISLVASALLLAGCASAPASDPRDPFESFNRGVNSVNRSADHAVLKPAASGYQRAVPGVVRTGVANFLGNLGDVWSSANSLLQLKIGDAAQNLMRFAVNSSFGLGGLIDIATDAGIERHKEDFGSTLAHWGVPSGPYLVLPLLGPSTVRDALALPVDWIGDPSRYVTPMADRNVSIAGRAVDARARALPLDAVLDSAFDPYTLMRDAYLQHRQAQVAGAAGGEVDPMPAEESGEKAAQAPAERD